MIRLRRSPRSAFAERTIVTTETWRGRRDDRYVVGIVVASTRHWLLVKGSRFGKIRASARVACNPRRQNDQCAFASFVQSQMEPFQFLIIPLSPQTGHLQTISSSSASISVSISPGHNFRAGRRRHLTRVFVDPAEDRDVASTTSLAWNSPNRFAGPEVWAIAPSLVKKVSKDGNPAPIVRFRCARARRGLTIY